MNLKATKVKMPRSKVQRKMAHILYQTGCHSRVRRK